MKLSIITVNYNDKIGLQKTIESVFNQTYKDFEYIVIDGGSTDGSKEVLEKYSDKISYWVSEKDSGIYNAMNKGIKQAKGEYCLFLNSGDWLINNEILLTVFNHFTNEDIVYGDIQTPHNQITYPKKLSLAYFFYGSICHSGAAFIKRNLFEKYGYYNEEYKITSDREFYMICILKNNCSYGKLDLAISFFDLDGISSKNQDLKNSENDSSNQKIFPALYDDYIEYFDIKNKLFFYENSKPVQVIKSIHSKRVYLLKKLKSVAKKILRK